MATEFLTGIFKLHNPGLRKRTVLDHVFEAYTYGMIDLLSLCHNNLDLIRDWGRVVTKTKTVQDKYKETSILSVLPKSGELNMPIASCLKEALLGNVASMLASFLELEGTAENTGFPSARNPSLEGYPNALKEFALVGGDVDDENTCRRQLLRQARGSVMPIHFSRSRDARLLYDRKSERFFVWLQLVPAKHELSQKTVVSDLIDLNTGEIFNRQSSTALLFPIELGQRNDDWHWQYHRFIGPLMAQQASVQSAKLIKEKDEYFLHVSFAFACPDPYEPETYIGIDRGVFYSMAYGLVDAEGGIIDMGHKEDGFRHDRIAAGKRVQVRQARGRKATVRDYRQKHLDSILHVVINDIIDLALKHRSMVVLEDLDIQIKGKFYKSAWKKMHKMLAYKCKLAGVPIWKGGIWAAYSSQICIVCGGLNRGRKRDGSYFVCPGCGATYHSDEGAGINIARRALYRKADWKDHFAFHRSFANEGHFGAFFDLRNRQEVTV